MPKNATLVRTLIAVALTALGVLVPAAAAHGAVTTSDRLVLTWAPDGKQLQVDGFGYRPQGAVEVGLGSGPVQRSQADGSGRVRVAVPEQFVTAGQAGTSIVVTGRSNTGASRVLISAVPPRAAVLGPADVLPWSIGVVAAGILMIGALLRLRSRRA